MNSKGSKIKLQMSQFRIFQNCPLNTFSFTGCFRLPELCHSQVRFWLLYWQYHYIGLNIIIDIYSIWSIYLVQLISPFVEKIMTYTIRYVRFGICLNDLFGDIYQDFFQNWSILWKNLVVNDSWCELNLSEMANNSCLVLHSGFYNRYVHSTSYRVESTYQQYCKLMKMHLEFIFSTPMYVVSSNHIAKFDYFGIVVLYVQLVQ